MLILLIVVLILLFGGGGGYYYGRRANWGGPHYGGGLLGLVLIILLVLWLSGTMGPGMLRALVEVLRDGDRPGLVARLDRTLLGLGGPARLRVAS